MATSRVRNMDNTTMLTEELMDITELTIAIMMRESIIQLMHLTTMMLTVSSTIQMTGYMTFTIQKPMMDHTSMLTHTCMETTIRLENTISSVTHISTIQPHIMEIFTTMTVITMVEPE